MKNIQVFEQEFVVCAISNKNIINNVYHHYVEKSHIVGLPAGRPNKRITSFTHNNNMTIFDMLCNFVLND